MAFTNASNVDARYGTWNDVGRDQYNNGTFYMTSGFEALSKVSAMGAAFDSAERHPAPKCIPGTREDVLTSISDWITGTDDRRICWLSGIAGSGKSAIAQSVAELCAEMKILVASFFFSRGHQERSVPHRLFPSIAYQLMVSVPSAKDVILKCLQDDPSIPHKILRDQFRRLVVQPLLAAKELRTSPMVVIIDSLDECTDDELVEEIISLLAETVRDGRLPIRFFVTSRPAAHIRGKFTQPDILPLTQLITLNNFNNLSDIRIYLEHSFSLIFKRHDLAMFGVQEPWPSEPELDLLVQRSGGLFIFASTLLKVVVEKGSRPNEQLNLVLGVEGDSGSSPNAVLDQLYLVILSASANGRFITGIIVHLLDPPSIGQLVDLLGEWGENVVPALGTLHALLHIPEDRAEPIRVHHSSLRDFLTDPGRSGDNFVDTPACHGRIARLCLRVMIEQLKRDPCDLKDALKPNKEFTDLFRRCDDSISPALRYACCHWASHLSLASLDYVLPDDLEVFSSTALLYWIETLSLIGDLQSALMSLQDATSWLKKRSDPPVDVIQLFSDAERFVLEFFDTINLISLQVYDSALLFTPTGTLLHQKYTHELTSAVTVLHGVEDEWNPCMRVIKLQSCPRFVAFSPDSARIASGSDDGTVQLWSTFTGHNLTTLDTNGKISHAVMFSLDGTRIATGCEDGSVFLWDAVTCYPLITSKQHEQAVTVMSFSPDSTRLASISGSPYIQIWDAVTGHHLHRLSGHDKEVKSVSFSHHGSRIVSGSADDSVRLWDLNTGQILRVFNGHGSAVNSVAFSIDDSRIASGSSDKTVQLWDTDTGKCLAVFKGHPKHVTAVAISQDGTRIISSSPKSYGRHILLWTIDAPTSPVCVFTTPDNLDFFTEAIPRSEAKADGLLSALAAGPEWTVASYKTTLSPSDLDFSKGPIDFPVGITPFVIIIKTRLYIIPRLESSTPFCEIEAYHTLTSSALSSDGTRAVSGSIDNSIRLWDARRKSPEGNSWLLFGSDKLSCSPDGSRFIHSSGTDTISYIDLLDASGSVLAPLHDGLLAYEAACSPDSSTIACYCNVNSKIKLFDAVTGKSTRELKKGSGWLSGVSDWRGFAAVAFSPDSAYIAGGCKDGTVWLWDVATGRSLATFRKHESRVWSVAYSRDGTRIASGSKDGVVQLWDATTKSAQSIASLECHQSKVTSIAFSPDGTHIAAGCKDGSIRLWWPSSGSYHLLTPNSIDGAVESILFSPTAIKCWSGKDNVHIWEDQRDSDAAPPWHHVSESKSGGTCDNSMLSAYVVRDDGWLFDGSRRVCWLPGNYRPAKPRLLVSCGDKVAMYVNGSGLVVLDLSNVHFP